MSIHHLNCRLVRLAASGLALLALSVAIPSIAQAAPSITLASAEPAQILAGQTGQVRISALINDPSLIAGSVNLQRVGLPNTTPIIVGKLHDDGLNGDATAADGRYTIEISLNEPAAKQVVYRISAAFKGQLQRLKSSDILVNVTAGGSLAASLEIIVSEKLIAPNGSITVTPVPKDANGNPISNSNFQFALNVTPVGPVTGNAATIQGLTVTFPKLAKRLLNQNVAIDPNGEFTDTDPTDPNYGKETGGKYRITATLTGTSLSSSQDVLVLPTGTAPITVKTNQYAGKLEAALAAALEAERNNDLVALAQVKVAMQAINGDPDFSFKVLSTTSVMTPPNGRLITPAQLTAAGFLPGAQDAQFALTVTTLITRIKSVTAQVNAINPAALTQSDLDALQNASVTYKQALLELQALRPSVLGITQQGPNINQVLGTELPLLLDAVKGKTTAMLDRVVTAGMLGSTKFAQTFPNEAATGKQAPLTPQSMYGNIGVQAAWQSPQAMYASTQPVFFSFFSFAFSTLTDLSGTARANIIELAASLINDIVNISIANIINSSSSGDLTIDYILGSSSLAFVCPDYAPSTIGGSGFGLNPNVIKVALIGCFDSQAIRNLLTLSKPRDLAAAIRLANKLMSLAEAAARGSNVAAVEVPDFIDEDFIFGGERLNFLAGWPRVNQGRLPCVGVVIVLNLDTGSIVAQASNFLGRCG